MSSQHSQLSSKHLKSAQCSLSPLQQTPSSSAYHLHVQQQSFSIQPPSKIKKSGGWTWTTHCHPTWTTGTNQKVNLSILEMLSGNGNLPESERQESNLRPHFVVCSTTELHSMPLIAADHLGKWMRWFPFAQHIIMFFVPLSSHQDKHQPFPMGLIRLNHRLSVHWHHRPNGLIAGDGFEPPFSRIWALWDSTSLSCDVHIWKNHFSTFTYCLL